MRKKLLTGIMVLSMFLGMILLPFSPLYNMGDEVASVSRGVEAEDYMHCWPSGLGYGFSFTVSNGEATIIHLDRRGTKPSELSQVGDSIDIPSTVIDEATGNVYPVTAIGTSAFAFSIMKSWARDTLIDDPNMYFNRELHISMPASIKVIRENAFDGGGQYVITTTGADNLLGNNVVTIGDYAFRGCGCIKGNLIVPSKVESIGRAAFTGTGFDGNLTFSDGATNLDIGESAFQGVGFKKFSFERKGIQSIGRYAFAGMYDLTCDGGNLFPATNTLLKIEEGAFSGNRNLFAVLNLPQGKNLNYIGPYAFSECENLSLPGQDMSSGIQGKLIIPPSITTIYDGTFAGCQRLYGTLNLNNVTSVGAAAFNQCVMLRGDLDLSKVTTMGEGAFSISTVYGNTIGSTIPTTLEDLAEKERTGYVNTDFLIGGFDGKLILSNQLKSIPANCFNGLVSLSGTLNIPSSVTTIGAAAFSDCRSFTGSIVIPESVTWVGGAAFKDMVGIKGTLTLSSKLTVIEGDTFKNCFNMTGSLKLPSGITAIGERAFYGDRSLTGGLSFPSGLVDIGAYSFFWCTGFSGGLTFPDSVGNIGMSAFEECAGLNGDIKLPKNLGIINPRVFYNLENIKSNEVIIPNTVFSIGELAFYNCVGIKKVRMERNVQEIHPQAFHALTDNKMIYHIYRYNSIPFEHLKTTHPDDYETRIEEIPDASDFKVYKLDANGKKIGNPIGENESIAIPFGKSIQLYAESYYANGKETGFSVIYEAENPEILGVDPYGNVSVVSDTASGEARIMVKDGNGGAAVRYVKFSITPRDQIIEDYTVKDGDGNDFVGFYDLFVGDSITFTISNIVPATVKAENQNISWSVSDDSAVQLTKNDAYGHSVTLKGLKNVLGVTVVMDADYGAGLASRKTIALNLYQKVKLISAVNVADGIQLTWDKVENSTGYSIFRKIKGVDEEAVRIADTSNEVNTFVDTSIMLDVNNIDKTISYYIQAGAGANNISNTVSVKYTNKKFSANGANYVLSGKNSVSFAGYTEDPEYIEVPAQIEAGGKIYKVTAISPYAFKDKKALVTVVIPNTVKTIGKEAFSGCKKLKKVTMGTAITSIGDSAFAKCKALTSITIPKKVKTIGKGAYAGCSKLKTVTFKGTKVTKIGSKAFKTIKKGATFKIPKKKFSKYKKLIKKSGAPKKAKYKKK